MSNRIGRLELVFWFVASILSAGILLSIVASLTNTAIEVGRTRHPLSQAVCLIVAAVVILRAVVCRFHDIGWSGWAVLLMFVPLLDIVALLLLLVVPAQKLPNLYGEPPIFLQRFRPTLRHPRQTGSSTFDALQSAQTAENGGNGTGQVALRLDLCPPLTARMGSSR
jgi:uncharacterized membrane protein YhaH (DUF805 family)